MEEWSVLSVNFLKLLPLLPDITLIALDRLPQAQLAYSSSECGDMIRYGIIMPLPAASPKTQKRANGSQTANEFKSAFETQVQDVW